jgi:DNA-binding response OmpR family regulator
MPDPARRSVLVVEDDAGIRELLRLHLDLAGFTIDEVGDGRQALDRARTTTFELILLDVMLPGLDGVSVCRAIRSAGPNINTPILMLTAREGESDKVLGLESGADDYLTKPFGVRELMARVAALLRRHRRQTAEQTPPTVVRAGDLSLDRERRQAIVRGERVELTKQEFDLLYLLASRPGAVFTRAALLEDVCGATTLTLEDGASRQAQPIRVRMTGFTWSRALRRCTKNKPRAQKVGTHCLAERVRFAI